jgi:flagellar basal body-associated protein FliL
MDETLISLILLIGFVAIAFVYERFWNGRSKNNQTSRKRERPALAKYKRKKSTL